MAAALSGTLEYEPALSDKVLSFALAKQGGYVLQALSELVFSFSVSDSLPYSFTDIRKRISERLWREQEACPVVPIRYFFGNHM